MVEGEILKKEPTMMPPRLELVQSILGNLKSDMSSMIDLMS